MLYEVYQDNKKEPLAIFKDRIEAEALIFKLEWTDRANGIYKHRFTIKERREVN